jgi:hypothetical protein
LGKTSAADDANAGRAGALATLTDLELDLVAIAGLGALHLGDVEEEVLALVLGDEAEALGGIEKLDGTVAHRKILKRGNGMRDSYHEIPA